MSTSTLYEKMRNVAERFVAGGDFSLAKEPLPKEQLLDILSSSFEKRWGFEYMSSQRPHMVPTDRDGFAQHVQGVSHILASLSSNVISRVVDEREKKAVVRVKYDIVVEKGGNEQHVPSEVVWALEFTSDGAKLESATEFIDGDASTWIFELVGAGVFDHDEGKHTT